jgi:hypothetical protein
MYLLLPRGLAAAVFKDIGDLVSHFGSSPPEKYLSTVSMSSLHSAVPFLWGQTLLLCHSAVFLVRLSLGLPKHHLWTMTPTRTNLVVPPANPFVPLPDLTHENDGCNSHCASPILPLGALTAVGTDTLSGEDDFRYTLRRDHPDHKPSEEVFRNAHMEIQYSLL